MKKKKASPKEHRKVPEMQYKKWIAEMAEGSSEALRLIYEALYQPTLLFVITYLHDVETAKDIVQETFLNAYQNAGQYQGKSGARTWILSIAKHLSLNAIKKERLTEYVTKSDSFNEDFTKPESAEALALLNHYQQRIMILSVFGGMRINEIAKLMEIPNNKAYYYKKTAVKKLKSYYSQNQ